jgi:N utilization substance protein A
MYLVKLFELEVPEILEGEIEIKSAAREPGQRAKIAVYTSQKDIDPVGACVGMKGSRVQNVVNELQGEKIDIVRWNSEVEIFARAALAPAEITNIQVDYQGNALDVVVDDDQLALAIGRRGQNVRLAAMLTGFKINIISKVKLQEKIKKAVESLIQIPLVTDARAQMLVQSGIMSIGDLAALEASVLADILHTQLADGEALLKATHDAIEKGDLNLHSDEDELVSASAIPAYRGLIEKHKEDKTDGKDKFSDAERRLREELAAFKLK